MRLTNQKVYEVVAEAIGEEAVPIVKYLKDRKNISDFKIAEKTSMGMQQVRNLLYKLHENNLVKYIRKKDRVKGWYISYFTFNKAGIKDLVEKMRKQKLDKYKQRLEDEEKNTVFYVCPNLCVRMDFDKAIDFDFRCPECGSLLKQQDNEKTKQHLKQKIKELEVAG